MASPMTAAELLSDVDRMVQLCDGRHQGQQDKLFLSRFAGMCKNISLTNFHKDVIQRRQLCFTRNGGSLVEVVVLTHFAYS